MHNERLLGNGLYMQKGWGGVENYRLRLKVTPFLQLKRLMQKVIKLLKKLDMRHRGLDV